MVAMSSGRFALHPDYILKSRSEGRFLSEAEYEFGNPEFNPELKASLTVDENLFNAAYKWRRWINFDHQCQFMAGAFTGLSFIAAIDKKPIIDILTKGGGKHYDVDFRSSFKKAQIQRLNIDICLFENLKQLSKENTKVLNDCAIKIVNFKEIKDYLLSPEVPKSLKSM